MGFKTLVGGIAGVEARRRGTLPGRLRQVGGESEMVETLSDGHRGRQRGHMPPGPKSP